MENKDQPAFPGNIRKWSDLDKKDIYIPVPGIPKREYFAAMALQGLLANTDYNCPSRRNDLPTTSNTAKAALHYADALLSELSKPQP